MNEKKNELTTVLPKITEYFNSNNYDLLPIYNVNSSSCIDPYYWPSKVHNKFLQFCVDKGPEFFQNKNYNFNDKNHTRHPTNGMFVRTLSNGEKCHQKWMLYSPSQGSIFCFMWKLFGSNRSKDNPFVCSGFDKWKKS